MTGRAGGWAFSWCSTSVKGTDRRYHLACELLTFFPTDSRPYVFRHLVLIGQVTKRIWGDNLGLQPAGTLPSVAARRPGSRADELPLDRNVVRFP